MVTAVITAAPDGPGGDGCQLVKVAAEDRENNRCFNEPECESVCHTVDSQVCTIIHRKECSPVTKDHCTKSSSPVCTAVYEDVCETVREPACSTGISSPHPSACMLYLLYVLQCTSKPAG